MKTAKIKVKKIKGSSCPKLSAHPPDAGVTVTNGTKITVPPERVQLKFVYEGGSLDGFKIAKKESELASAPVMGKDIGEVNKDDGFDVKRTSHKITIVTDEAQPGTWHFKLCLDGKWVDPQIYNKGTGG